MRSFLGDIACEFGFSDFGARPCASFIFEVRPQEGIPGIVSGFGSVA